VSEREQQYKDLQERHELLIQAVHDMYDLIRKLRNENRQLKETIEEYQNG